MYVGIFIGISLTPRKRMKYSRKISKIHSLHMPYQKKYFQMNGANKDDSDHLVGQSTSVTLGHLCGV